MYTNLDTTTGLQALRQLFQTYNNLIPASFPRVFFLTSLEIVMKNNIYTFGDTSWWQLQGTAVGTPAAPLYSILTYGYHENSQILPDVFSQNIVYYKRYIDDIVGIWVDTLPTKWEELKTQLNPFGSLLWNIE
jgi:hypothetical protein